MQHFVPCFYLAEFTRERSPDGAVWVLDRLQRRQWRSTPRKTAKEGDFYTGDFGPSAGAFDLETTLAGCEAKWAEVIRGIIDSSCLPREDEDSFGELIAFIAFQAMRGPATRESIAELMDEYSRAEVQAKLSDTRYWESFVEHMEGTGQAVPLTREELLEYAKGDDYVVEVDKTWKIQRQISAAIALMPILFARQWSLFTPGPHAPDFICSDSPVCVTSKDGQTERSIGFCKTGASVSFPLGRRHAVVGYFEGRLNMQLPACEVAGLNAMTTQHARWIYSSEEQFTLLTSTGDISGPQALLQA